jgi:2-polyprenyl-3-methyl-5-hydroxy-6-metoxy-1,4-benzoquinol methylase
MVTREFAFDPPPDQHDGLTPGTVPASGDPSQPNRCPACGCAEFRILFQATDRVFRTTPRVFQIVECRSCRLIRLHPCPSPAELAPYYPKNYWFSRGHTTAEHLEEVYRRFVLRDHLRFVRRAIEASGESGLILDVGCGGGLFLKMMAELGHRTAGLDFSLDAATIAWKENGVPVACGSLTQAPFPPNSCAAITMFHVLEHLHDPCSYVECAHSLLRPGGRLIVQVPNAACWQFLLLGHAWLGVDVPRHLIDFRAHDLEVLLDHCGFQVVRRKYFSLRDNPAGFATSLAPGLDPMARKVRGAQEGPKLKLFKDLLYFGLTVACLPFTVLEAACCAGSTVMLEGRKKP